MTSDDSVIQLSESTYPDQLRAVLPNATLWCLGNVDLIKKKSIGICGSRAASPDALAWAHRFGTEAAAHGLVVVSGYARGVDRQAHKGALEGGGATIAVLPDGLNYFRLVKDLRNTAHFDENFLAVSMFEPTAVWKSWRAMQRNKLIVGLSAALIVVEAQETGGTIAAAMECLRQKKKLWAVAYSTQLPGREGNQILLQESAIPLKRLSDLRSALESTASGSDEDIKQLVLDLV